MTSKEAIAKIRVLLGVEEPKEQVSFASATLIDGTEVSVEGEFEVGKPLFVVTPEGNIPAPEGIHQTTENLLVTVDAAGVITQIEEIAEEMEEEKKEEMEEVEVEVPEEVSEVITEEVVTAIVEALAPVVAEVKEVAEEMKKMKAKFEKFSKEPAAKPIKKADAFESNKITAVERLAKLRKK